MHQDVELIGRIVLAGVLGAIIGYERQFKHKSAGLRTNILVCVGSCLIMILSVLIYKEVEGRTNADPARLAAQVVSGIGFLGAGAIIKEGVNVIGLTTAACIWCVAGVGLATGAGYYTIAIFTSILVFVLLAVLSELDNWLGPAEFLTLRIAVPNDPELIIKIQQTLGDMGLSVKNFNSEAIRNNDVVISMRLSNARKLSIDAISQKLSRLPHIKSIELS